MAGLAAAGGLCALLLLRPDSSEQKAAEETRRTLRQQGFKTDLSEFNFAISDELRARAAALTNADLIAAVPRGAEYARRAVFLQNQPDLMATVGSDAAMVAWKQDGRRSKSGEDTWAVLRETLEEDRPGLDAACEAALSGPIRFNLIASRGSAMLLPHLATLKRLAQSLATRVVLELHDGNKDAAWTNLLALTRLVTAYDPEPAEISHLVRFACATIAYNATWQALQSDGWADDRLAQLQREWESADFFRGLPETAAFTRASAVATCQLERQQPLGSFGITLSEIVHSPRYAWPALTERWRQLRYRNHGSFEDEKALLLYYRDREIELRRAARSATWTEMRELPGVTNTVYFQSRYPSRVQSMMNLRRLSLASQLNAQGQRQGLPGRAAEAEARRRIVITAIALERFRVRHGVYPKTLQELAPDLVKNPPVDFMDGQPLRYRRADDGQFVLYSVGLDCIDNNGEMPRRRPGGYPYVTSPETGPSPETDLVWPRPASNSDVETFRRKEIKIQAEAADRMEDSQAEEQWQNTARRQAKVEKLLETEPAVRSTEPKFRGRPLSEALLNKSAAGTNRFTLDDLLTLKQVTTGEEPEKATFELPVNHDVLTNIGTPYLLVDPVRDDDSDEGCVAGEFECRRATNGNCLIVLSTIYESPGKHALQLGFELNERVRDDKPIVGPITPFVVSNLCQFSLTSAHFNPAFGATLRGKLPESNGTYSLEISSPRGERLRTLNGATSNGVIKVFWDLTDERGRKCTNNAYDTLVHITLPDSGRSQTLKGP